ncbi:response regulator transcription factor [Hymenobacter sp. 15J16-1T3B]|uniref:response regulator transcription factor n=1 Tax=Hymenobacter sp. 15J16-1T3B TaxID=2886941 RepID=UPI001D11E7DF|nr:response regulator transcription factor [Hymenobacter sp. 15J16-1T3B]MCC3160518.1 response regulator transcription factor [Hymenobacter sp. 15J16-1T3B]
MPSILLIEDEPALGMIVKDSLEVRGFQVRYAADGQEGLELFRQECPDIVVADVMMPRLDGFSLAEIIRRENARVPIIFLTARSQPADVVRGFELGGSDYLKKPFSMDELIVRIRARLGQPAAAPAPTGVLGLGQYQFDHPKQRLHRQGQEVPLTHREAELLKRLYDQRNQVLERTAVLRELWGDDNFFNGRSLDVFITRLRRYLRDDPQVQIVNVRGIGYKLVL